MASRPSSRVILKMSVQLPDGRKGTIHVFPDDRPRELAEKFCKKYELTDPKMVDLVEKHVVDNVHALQPNGTPPKSATKTGVASPTSAGHDGVHELRQNGSADVLSRSDSSAQSNGTPPSDASDPFGTTPSAAGDAARANGLKPNGVDHALAHSIPRISEEARDAPPDEDPFAENEADTHGSPPNDKSLAFLTHRRPRAEDKALLRLCWRAMQTYCSWERDVAERQAAADRYEKKIAEHELEIAELHSANSRIAVLAFSQGGLSQEEAQAKVEEVLAPSEQARAAAAAAQKQLQALELKVARLADAHARAVLRRRDEESVRHTLQSWREAVAAERAALDADGNAAAGAAAAAAAAADDDDDTAAAPSAKEQVAALHQALELEAQKQAEARAAVEAAEAAAAAANAKSRDTDEALRNALAQIESMRSELNDKVREVDDLTDMLIEAKLSQAEMNGEVLGTKHDLRRAEIKVQQIIVEAEAHAIEGKKSSRKGVVKRESFPRDGPRRKIDMSKGGPATPSASPNSKAFN